MDPKRVERPCGCVWVPSCFWNPKLMESRKWRSVWYSQCNYHESLWRGYAAEHLGHLGRAG